MTFGVQDILIRKSVIAGKESKNDYYSTHHQTF
jgi:hypothetical protein